LLNKKNNTQNALDLLVDSIRYIYSKKQIT